MKYRREYSGGSATNNPLIWAAFFVAMFLVGIGEFAGDRLAAIGRFVRKIKSYKSKPKTRFIRLKSVDSPGGSCDGCFFSNGNLCSAPGVYGLSRKCISQPGSGKPSIIWVMDKKDQK